MNEIEYAINKRLEGTLSRFDLKMKEKGISCDLAYNSSGKEETYFSEIEATFWKDDNVLDVISVIMHIDGKIRNTEENFTSWFEDELIELIKEA